MENKIVKTAIISFSPKGGTLNCAKALAGGIGGNIKIYDITLPHSREKICQVGDDDVVIFAFPVFGGHPQNFFKEYIKNIVGSNTKAVLLAVYGNRDYDMAFREVYDIVTEKGFDVISCVAAVAEHSFNNAIQTGRPDANDLQILNEFGVRIKNSITDNTYKVFGEKSVPQKPVDIATIGMHGVRLRSMTPNRPIIGDNCIKCGKCGEICPAGIIDINSPDVFTSGCIFCRACARACPVGAIEFTQENYSIVAEDCMKEFGTDIHTPEIWL